MADTLRQEANEIIHERGLDAILQPYGRVWYGGSYALDLMAWPDLDISMLLNSDSYSFDDFFAIGRKP